MKDESYPNQTPDGGTNGIDNPTAAVTQQLDGLDLNAVNPAIPAATAAFNTSAVDPAAMSGLMGQNPNAVAAAAAAAAVGMRNNVPVVPPGPMQQHLNSGHGGGGGGVNNAAAMGLGIPPGVPGVPGMPPNAGGTGAPNSGQRVWQGELHVRGHRNDMIVPCVAMRYPTPSRPPVHDTQSWPVQIHCDSSKLKQCANVFKYINEPASEWYVRFAPIDDKGEEISDSKLVQLVKVMVQRQLAFEIDCGEGTMRHGTLFLWGMPMPPHGLSLLGVFRPKPPAE